MDVISRALEDQNLFPFTHRTGNLSPGKQYARPSSLHVRIGSHRFCRSLRCLFGRRHGTNHSFGPLGGVLADRGNPKAMMVGLDLASGTLTPLATLLVGHSHDLPVLCATLILLSILGAFETPVAQACLPLLLQGESLCAEMLPSIRFPQCLPWPVLFWGVLPTAAWVYNRFSQSVGFVFLLTALLECFFAASCFSPSPNWQRRNMGHYQVGSSRLYPPHLPRAAHVAPSPTPDLCLGLFCPGDCPGGPPFLVRTVLGLSATHYGILESILAFASIVGSILAGLLTNRLSTERLFLPLLLLGAVLFPVGFAFLLPLALLGDTVCCWPPRPSCK